MSERCGGVKGGEAGERTSLVGVEEAARPGEEGQAGGSDPLHYLREGF